MIRIHFVWDVDSVPAKSITKAKHAGMTRGSEAGWLLRHTGDKIIGNDFEHAKHGLKGGRQEPGVMPVSMNQVHLISI